MDLNAAPVYAVGTVQETPTLDDIRIAAERIAGHVHCTPIMRSTLLDQRAGAAVLFKCEHLQRAGAFKARGAANAVLSLSPEVAGAGVATHSSGNHGAALALAARNRGISAQIVMPRTSPVTKQAAVQGYGGEIHFCEPTLEARERTLRELVERTGAEIVHPYDDWRVIAGQGTAAMELLEAHPELEVIIVPVGGGGLISGTALVAKALKPDILVIGIEPAGADDAARGFRAGARVTGSKPETIADGLRAELGERNFGIIMSHVDDILTVSEPSIVAAMRFTWERMKQVIEPSAATVVAALLDGHEVFGGRRIGAILSGGNVDLDALPWRDE